MPSSVVLTVFPLWFRPRLDVIHKEYPLLVQALLPPAIIKTGDDISMFIV